jgi:aspartokinase-like uncharacterized kinase
MWIVKLGGSLAADPSLAQWLSMLGRHGGRVAIVPGGGPFAEHVRSVQAAWRLDDRVAHNMAILGMAQFTMLMQGLCETLVPADSIAAIAAAARGGRVPLWLPFDLLRSNADELTSWDVTSDSLAAWLANRLGAKRLVLVKSCAIPAEASPAAWAEAGIVDRSFPKFVRGATYALDLVHSTQWSRVERALRDAYGDSGARGAS